LSGPEQHRQALSPGTELQRYRLLEVLGVGGFGVTYLAEHVALGHRVAVKEYLPNELALRHGTTVQPKSPTDQPDFEWGLARFLDEAQTLARFEHRNLVRVRDFFAANRTAYMVMDFEEGEPLSRLLERRGSLPEDELERLVVPLADGLAEVHAAGFLHRDIKPSNVYVRQSDGSPVLLDFGAARQALGRKSRSLTAVASAGYAPPEQYESDGEQGPWTDVYGLSALCYRAIAGEAPTEATRRMNRLVQGRPDPLMRLGDEGPDGYSAALLAAVDRGLDVDATKRPGSVNEWLGVWLPRLGPMTVGPPPGAPRRTVPQAPAPLGSAPTTAAHSGEAPLIGRPRTRWFGWAGRLAIGLYVLALLAVVGAIAVAVNRGFSLGELEDLLGRPPDPAAVDANGWTDLHWAAVQGNAKAAAWLLEQGAAVDARAKEDGEEVDTAARDRLLHLGLSPWVPRRLGESPLMLAWRSEQVAEVLLASGAEIDARDPYGRTPLHLAALEDSVAVAELLLASGADVDARDAAGGTPLQSATVLDSVTVAELLLASGADVDARDAAGDTPLHRAAFNRSVEVAELLLASGADVDAKNAYVKTPLHEAVPLDSDEVAELLLAGGADVNARDADGETPLHEAAKIYSLDVAKLLLASGAEVNARRHDGLTPLDQAIERRSGATFLGRAPSVASMLDILRRHGAVASWRGR